ncbi:MAG: gliding motility-associated C-terminal domain-containing protein [Flavobacteriales bacterium]|nr:gliding motility-associated C-terminal domain-containing protein [Flavobacteriales bacterium]MCW8912652.1 gliding motility-associated C-terminal domain-containing protein [Flavobacteriales bacterium]MCW8938257.1 gliding motility-associated C-terminal domain-containing protein [Flavobacteriales bacterium]MCW8969100.1 gliding motility-associated C-terminal domain-containing protein [Flavobacteriales bacterium]MCW8990961.1 gliding motility-associated C-terminal domain-containing protein [Flavob
MKQIFFFILLLITNHVISQCTQGSVSTFQKAIGGTGNERAHSVQQTTDGGYIIVGETTSFGAGAKDWFIIKMDANGNAQWTKTYGGILDDDGLSIIIKQTSDGGYIVCGLTNSFGASQDPYILKLNNTGNIQWEKRIPGSSPDYFRDIHELANGNFIFTGSVLTVSTGNSDAYFCEISPSGNLISNTSIGENGRSHSTSITELPSGNFILSGNTNFSNVDNANYIKVDANGNVIWSKEYGLVPSSESFYKTILLNDGNLLSVGLIGNASFDILLMKSDTNGNVIWTKSYGGANNDVGVGVKEKSNGELIISAYTSSFGSSNELLLINTDSSGNVIWSKSYGGTANELTDNWGRTHEITASGEVIIVGGTTSFGAGSEDIYIVKTNECGESFCNEQNVTLTVNSLTFSPINYSVQTLTGNTLVNTSTIVNTINFTDSYLCADTVTTSSPCNLSPNFSATNACLGDSTFFTDLSVDSIGNIVNWQWYFGDGDSLIGIQNPSHLYNGAGNYNVTLIITNNINCVDSITISITVNPSYSSTQSASICQGDSIFLAGNFQNSSGQYTDSLSTTLGCDSLIITNLVVNPTFNDSTTVAICQGDSVFLNGSFQYNSGIFTDSLQSIAGCDSVVTTSLTVNPSSSIIASNDTTIEACGSVQLNANGGVSYLWSPPTGLSCISCQNPIASPIVTTSYVVSSTTNGCSDNDTVIVIVEGSSSLIIPNVFTPNQDGINDGFNFSGGCLSAVNKKIFNRWGQLLFESNQIAEEWNGRTKAGEKAPEGTYFYIFTISLIEDGNETTKIFKGTLTLLR